MNTARGYSQHVKLASISKYNTLLKYFAKQYNRVMLGRFSGDIAMLFM
jgi:hypothetical protein